MGLTNARLSYRKPPFGDRYDVRLDKSALEKRPGLGLGS